MLTPYRVCRNFSNIRSWWSQKYHHTCSVKLKRVAYVSEQTLKVVVQHVGIFHILTTTSKCSPVFLCRTYSINMLFCYSALFCCQNIDIFPSYAGQRIAGLVSTQLLDVWESLLTGLSWFKIEWKFCAVGHLKAWSRAWNPQTNNCIPTDFTFFLH